MNIWSNIRVFFCGKRIAIIGQQRTGKTALTEYLLTGQIPEIYEPTVAVDTHKGRKISIKELKLKVDKIEDPPGDRRAYWKKPVEKADIVIYLTRADFLKNPDQSKIHQKAIKDMMADVRAIRDWRNEVDKGWDKKFAILVTHWDKVGKAIPEKDDAYNKIQQFAGYSELERVIAGLGGRLKVPVTIASLLKKRPEATELSVCRLLHELIHYGN